MYRIWVFGAGAVGGFYGAKLVQAGHEVLFVARGAHLQAMQNRGLTVESIDGDIHLKHVKSCTEDELKEQFPPDFVIVATKANSNRAVAKRLQVVLAPHIPVLVFQNGLYSERIFENTLIKDRVCRAISQLSSAIIAAGKIRHSANGDIQLPKGGPGTDELRQAFEGTGVKVRVIDDFKEKVWSKQVWNASFNTVSALACQTTHPILRDPDGERLIRELMGEVIMLARANQVNLTENLIDDQIGLTLDHLGDISTSTFEDVKARKSIEYQAIIGDLVEEAARLKLEIPHLKTVYTLLKLLNETLQNSKIDFNRQEKI